MHYNRFQLALYQMGFSRNRGLQGGRRRGQKAGLNPNESMIYARAVRRNHFPVKPAIKVTRAECLTRGRTLASTFH